MTGPRWHRHPHVLWRRSLDTVVVLADGLDEPIALAGTGPELWALLAVPRTAEEIVDALAAAHDTAPEAVAIDVLPVLEQLDRAGVISRV
jgi:hypothetical protein